MVGIERGEAPVATRHEFDAQLSDLQRDILRMGTMVEESIARSLEALRERNAEIAQQVIDGDDRIDQFMVEMEQRCLQLIATQQPLASDLRVIGAAIKIITDLERMADHSVNMARATLRLMGQPLIKPLVDIPRMAEIVQTMTRSALNAYVHRDPEEAARLQAADHGLDALYKRVFGELQELMHRDPSSIDQGLQLLLLARDLERMGDHATNLGEWVIFMATGDRRSLND